jgi:hypothetical protein
MSMAISSISALGPLPGASIRHIGRVGLVGRGEPVPRVESIPRLEGREERPEDPGKAETGKGEPAAPSTETRAVGPRLDPRGSAWILNGASGKTAAAGDPTGEAARADPLSAGAADGAAARAEEKSAKIGAPAAPSERQVREKLGELMGEKAREERKRSDGQGARSSEIERVLSALRARDGEVRAHESAHIAAGGRYVTGGASFSYQRGPDGANYAVGGEVGIDTSPASSPRETAMKMRIVRAAALAPAEPSGADLSVAAAAASAEGAALAEIAASRAAVDPATAVAKAYGIGRVEDAGRIDLVA